MVNTLVRCISVALVVLLSVGCAKKEAAKAPAATEAVAESAAKVEAPSTEAVKPAEPAAVEAVPRPGEKALKSSLSFLGKCAGDHLEQLELDQYKEGNLTIDITAMDRVCKRVFSELDSEFGGLLFLHKTLDDALFQLKLLKDSYQRVKLYALRVGNEPGKNTKKLKTYWIATRKAARAYKIAAKAWMALENPPSDTSKIDAVQRTSFINAFSRRFQSFLAKPVKAKTAIYYGVADYLQLGLSRMGESDSGLDSAARTKLQALEDVFSEARAFYKEFDRAAKSKKDYAKKVKRAVKAVSSAVPSAR